MEIIQYRPVRFSIIAENSMVDSDVRKRQNKIFLEQVSRKANKLMEKQGCIMDYQWKQLLGIEDLTNSHEIWTYNHKKYEEALKKADNAFKEYRSRFHED